VIVLGGDSKLFARPIIMYSLITFLMLVSLDYLSDY